MQRTRHPKISIWKNIPMDRDKLRRGINELVTIAKTQTYSEIVAKIKELVPEYTGWEPMSEGPGIIKNTEN